MKIQNKWIQINNKLMKIYNEFISHHRSWNIKTKSKINRHQNQMKQKENPTILKRRQSIICQIKGKDQKTCMQSNLNLSQCQRMIFLTHLTIFKKVSRISSCCKNSYKTSQIQLIPAFRAQVQSSNVSVLKINPSRMSLNRSIHSSQKSSGTIKFSFTRTVSSTLVWLTWQSSQFLLVRNFSIR